MSGLRWMRRSTERLAAKLSAEGLAVSPRTVAKYLQDMGYSLRVNAKRLAGRSARHPERDAQFQAIKTLLTTCRERGLPFLSVDTKKKELIGRFLNKGAAWARQAEAVNDHDFPSQAQGKAIPYGIYDPVRNRGAVAVGDSADTPAFAVDAIRDWWLHEGREHYPAATRLVIVCDCGGSNGYRCRAWKHGLQHRLCNPYGLRVTVAHYPPGCSKWNPIEHRLFSEISKNWAGRPLASFRAVLNYVRTTKTRTGLEVRAWRVEQQYPKGVKISDEEMQALNLTRGKQRGGWNYTLAPQGQPPAGAPGAASSPAASEPDPPERPQPA